MSEPSERQLANVELARRGLDAFVRGDLETVLSVVSNEVEIFSSPALANSGIYHGHDGFLHWSGEWVEAWEGLDLEVISIEPVGESHVLAAVHQSAHGRASGVAVEMDVVFVFQAGGERCVYLALLPDWESALELVREREEGG
jgi:ketosteroid isomerase-like protein